jgi:hypothetical protein
MSLAARRLIILAAGVAAALLAWPLAQLLVGIQESFPTYLLFTVASGALFGAFFGLAFGSVDGISGGVSARKWVGVTTGAVFGLIAGAVGALAGQALYLWLGQWALRAARESKFVGLPIARAVGWSIMGVIIGASEGSRLRSVKRALIGAAGGFLGGITGGLVLEYSSLVFPDVAAARPAGSVALGLLLAAGFALMERRFLIGTLVLITGPLRGREYPLPPGRTTIGSGLRDTISLVPYGEVKERNAIIYGDRSGLVIEPGRGSRVVVNEAATEDRLALKYDDVIDVGSARFFLKSP